LKISRNIAVYLHCLLILAVPLTFFRRPIFAFLIPKLLIFSSLFSLIMVTLAWFFLSSTKAQRHKEVTSEKLQISDFPHSLAALLQRIGRSPSIMTVLLLLQVFSLVLSTVFSVKPSLSWYGSDIRSLSLPTAISLIALFWTVTLAVQRREQVISLLKTFAMAGFLLSIFGMVQRFFPDLVGFEQIYGPRIYSTIGNPEFLANVLLYCIFLNLGLYFYVGHRVEKAFYIFSFILTAAVLVATYTRGAWIGAFAGVLFFIIVLAAGRNKEKMNPGKSINRLKAAMVVLLLIALFMAGLKTSGLSQGIMNRLQDPFTVRVRLLLWRDSLALVKQSPLFGSGHEAFRVAFAPLKSLELARLEPGTNYDNPHNNYLAYLANYGFFGLLVYLTVIAVSIRRIFVFISLQRSREGLALATSIGASFIAVLVHNLANFDILTTLAYFYLYIGVIELYWRFSLGPSASQRLNLQMCPNAEQLAQQSIANVASGQGEHASLPDNHPALQASKDANVARDLKGALLKLLALCLLLPAAVNILSVYRTYRGYSSMWAADSLASEGQLEAAVKHNRQAVAYLPKSGRGWLSLGQNYFKLAEKKRDKASVCRQLLKDAVEAAERALPVTDNPESALNLIAASYMNLENYDQAMRYYVKSISHDPNYALTLVNFGSLLAYKGQLERALPLLSRAVAVEPKNIRAHALRCLVASNLGEISIASSEAEFLSANDDGSWMVKEALKSMNKKGAGHKNVGHSRN
jgi:O-antigen ligase